MPQTANPVHPSAQELQQFDAGQLNGPAAEAVESHLETCVECCRTLQGLGENPLLDRLRVAVQAKPDNGGTLACPISETSADATNLESHKNCMRIRATASWRAWAAAAWVRSTVPSIA